MENYLLTPVFRLFSAQMFVGIMKHLIGESLRSLDYILVSFSQTGYPCPYFSSSNFLSTFAAAVLGRESTNTTDFGSLNFARRVWQ